MHKFWQITIFTTLVAVVYSFLLNDVFAWSAGGAVFGIFAPNPILNGGSSFNVGDSPTGGTLCAIVGMVNSGIGQTIAALSVIFLGIGALFGKVRWEAAILLGVGIALIFGAASLIGSLPSYKSSDYTTTKDINVNGINATLNNKGEVSSCN
jgi:type IV secretion system protein VirB2